jgi:hypothetical protein
MDKDRIDLLMKNLGITESEAIEVLEADQQIDKGEKLFELTAEQSKASKQARTVPRTPTAYNFTKRERKADDSKRELIDLLVESLTPKVNNLDVVNAERELTFIYNDRKFKIVLSAPRS